MKSGDLLCLLMLVSKKVVDRFDGIEGAEGNLYEDGAPIAHGAIP